MSNFFNVTIHDFENICRICLSREDLKPLYGKCFPSATSLVDMLMACTFVKYSENDGLPTKICVNCIHELDQAFSFAKCCKTTDKILHNCVNKINAEFTNYSSQSQAVDPIIKADEEMQIEIKPEFNLPNIHRTVDDVLEDYKLVDVVKQEEKVKLEIKSEIILPNLHLRVKEILKDYKYMEEVKQEEELIIENEYDETYDDPADESYKEDVDADQDETCSETSDALMSSTRRRNINSQIQEECSKEDDSHNLSKIKLKSPYYECKECFEKFSDFKVLEKHLEVKHSPNSFTQTSSRPGQHKNARHYEPNCQMYQCQTCDKSFKRLVLLNAHQKIHTWETNENEYDFADESYEGDLGEDRTYTEKSDKFGVKRRSVNSQIQEESSEDDTPLAKIANLLADSSKEEEKRIHTEEKSYTCEVCSKTFSKSASLKIHLKIHTGEKPYTCEVCSKTFSQSSHLNSHMKIHTGEKPYTCEVCGKTCRKSSNLNSHMKIHTGEKPYTCEVCSKTFSQSSHVNCHMKIHTGEKPYTCEVCSKTFSQSSHLHSHMKKHTGEKPYTCDVCTKTFSHSSGLKYHLKTHTGETLDRRKKD